MPPIAIYVQLEEDKTTPSGYKWTSGEGPEVKIRSGTMCGANIIVETHKPITLLFPSIKKVTK
jgi:HlyD family secretion protein